MLDEAIKSEDRPAYPPYNIEKPGEDVHRLTLAVAGWTRAELTITAQPGLLVVSGRKPMNDSKRYLHRGIPSGSFEHCFALVDDVEVPEAQMANGLLTIEFRVDFDGGSLSYTGAATASKHESPCVGNVPHRTIFCDCEER